MSLVTVLDNVTETTNGMPAYVSTTSDLLDIFNIIGSSARDNQNVLGMISKLAKKRASADEKLLLRKLLFWSRDKYCGCGVRSVFRHVVSTDPDLINLSENMYNVLEFGRIDDLFSVYEGAPKAYRDYVDSMVFTIMRGKDFETLTGVVKSKTVRPVLAKWLPRKGKLARHFMKLLVPKSRRMQYAYRTFVVSYSETVEQKICAKEFAKINYREVPSKAMLKHSATFDKFDGERFEAFKETLLKAPGRVSGLYPYEIYKHTDVVLSASLWKTMVDGLKFTKTFLPVVDVSGSMGLPTMGKATLMDIAVSLGLMFAHANKTEFGNRVLTFSSEPKWVQLEGDLHKDKVSVLESDWGMTTNLMSVFNMILVHAKISKVSQSDMPDVLVVLSDMQFDQAGPKPALATIREMYERSGYTPPKIVFWNLSSGYKNVVTNDPDEPDICLMSGYNAKLLECLVSDTLEKFTPMNVMLETLNNPRYDNVR